MTPLASVPLTRISKVAKAAPSGRVGAVHHKAAAPAADGIAGHRQFQPRGVGDLTPVHGVKRPGAGDIGGKGGQGGDGEGARQCDAETEHVFS
jgi:hypothetical protein